MRFYVQNNNLPKRPFSGNLYIIGGSYTNSRRCIFIGFVVAQLSERPPAIPRFDSTKKGLAP